MIDTIAMIAMLILYIVFFLIALCTYLLIKGVDMCKTPQERFDEDQEEMEYVSSKNK